VPDRVRERIEADLGRRDRNALARAKARADEAQRLAEVEDARVITLMNAARAEQGKEQLNAQQEASVRDGRRGRRTPQL